MQGRPPLELAGLRLDRPAGEGARGLADVALSVVALAEREELHHLAREVLVRLALAIGRRIEVDHHRRVLRDGVQKLAEIPHRVPPEEQVLAVHQVRVAHLLLARREMAVPEKGHPLAERRRRVEHLLDPPRAEVEAAPDLLREEALAFLLGSLAELARRND